MIVYVNSNNEIKDVDYTKDTSLIPLEINDEDNPFLGWSVAKICCYKVNVSGGVVTMMTPYVDSRLLEHIDQLGKQSEETSSNISGNYSDTESYSENQYCTYLGNLYRFTQANGRGIPPTNTTYWVLCDIATELNRIINLINK